MVTAQQTRIQKNGQNKSSIDEIHFRLREALFSYSTQRREGHAGVPANVDEILTAKEIHICNKATD